MKKFKKLQNVKVLNKKAQQQIKGGWISCSRPGARVCPGEDGRCVPAAWDCP